MTGMRRRCRRCRQPLVLPGIEETSSVSKAMLATDADDLLKGAVSRAVTRLAAIVGEHGGETGKRVSGKQWKELN